MNPELLYQIALTLVPNIGPVQARILLQHFSPKEIFTVNKTALEKVEGIGSVRANSIQQFTNFQQAEEEIRLMEKLKIQPLFITDQNYPQRLLHCYDSPTLLYYRGNADLNTSRTIAVIGTRTHSEYGKQQTEKLIRELAPYQITVISGLAYGIDGIAHRMALKYQLPTVAVLAHGLDQLYPQEHAGLAKEMLHAGGGLLTEFRNGVQPDKHHFPVRNRIVAGMSDAIIVIETGIKGGSMITAELGNSYQREVFAIPGRLTDAKSAGCNHLIRENKAVLLNDTRQFLEWMNWDDPLPSRLPRKELLSGLNPEEERLLALFNSDETVHVDKLLVGSDLSNSQLASVLLNLELHNVVLSLPGKLYKLA